MKFLRRSDTNSEHRFLQIFERYHTPVFNYVYRSTGQRESTEDIVQEVFLKVYKHLPRYREERKLNAWIFKIAHNTMYDYFRKTRAHHQLFTEVDDVAALEGSDDYSPEQYLLSAELQEQFESIVMNLPYRLKEVFLLRHEAGLSFKEISKLLHCPVNRLLGRMHLAVKRIRAEMRQFLEKD